ncbi:MAG: serine protease, partial [Bacteroidia bacterium]|nr:serine protease [Bacteroidia bacterium]
MDNEHRFVYLYFFQKEVGSMFFRQPRKLVIPLFFLPALLLVVLLVGIASAEEFTPAMIREFSPAVKLLLTDDGKDNFGQGTGFFISSEGYLLTNYHVVQGSKKIVILEDEKIYEVKRVIDFNEEADVALLETDYPRSKIHYLPL